MKQELALRLLAHVMEWDAERARREFQWLSLMSRMKYDGYRGFVAGIRFIESLADWLQQFAPAERQAAYDFVRRRLVYISDPEIQQLVELFYPETVRRRLLRAVAEDLGLPVYRVWAAREAADQYEALLRRTLFIGLSDGARVDLFRRANTGIISNEQVVVAPQITEEKWDDLQHSLREDTSDPSAQFSFVYVFDDFAGSGRTLLRRRSPGEWRGKMPRLWDELQKIRDSHLAETWTLCVHHYIASRQASTSIQDSNASALVDMTGNWFENVEFSFGLILPRDLPVDEKRDGAFLELVEKYYDPAVETQHTRVGGSDMRRGFGGCGLPLVLEHNAPNNALTLLWAETAGVGGQHAMRPLFRRRQRHV